MAETTLSKEARECLANFAGYFDQSGQYDYARMDPERGGLFEDELPHRLGVHPNDAHHIMEELRDAGMVTTKDVPKMVPTQTVWLTRKGYEEGNKLIPELREEAKRASQGSDKGPPIPSTTGPITDTARVGSSTTRK